MEKSMIRFENVSKEYIDSDVQLKKSFKEKLFTKKGKENSYSRFKFRN